MGERRSDFSNRSAVTSELHVGGEERDFFDKRLGDQKAIEGIFVKRRQSLDIDGMFAGDRELDVAIVEESTPENARPSGRASRPVSTSAVESSPSVVADFAMRVP